MLLFTFHLNIDLRCVDWRIVMAFSLTSSKRTHLKGDFYAIGALKWGIYGINSFEDDLEAFLGKNSLSFVQYFTQLQVGAAVFRSRLYCIKGLPKETHLQLLTEEMVVPPSLVAKLKCSLRQLLVPKPPRVLWCYQCQRLIKTSVNDTQCLVYQWVTSLLYTNQTGTLL